MKIKLATQEQLENVKSETFENMLKKQDKLTAGDNIYITGDTISAVDTIYDDSKIKADIDTKQDKLIAGEGIEINKDGKISSTFKDEIRPLVSMTDKGRNLVHESLTSAGTTPLYDRTLSLENGEVWVRHTEVGFVNFNYIAGYTVPGDESEARLRFKVSANRDFVLLVYPEDEANKLSDNDTHVGVAIEVKKGISIASIDFKFVNTNRKLYFNTTNGWNEEVKIYDLEEVGVC